MGEASSAIWRQIGTWNDSLPTCQSVWKRSYLFTWNSAFTDVAVGVGKGENAFGFRAAVPLLMVIFKIIINTVVLHLSIETVQFQ